MNVNLTPELERFVQEKVNAGLYRSQSEVVREALRLLARQDRIREARIERLRGARAQGIAKTDRGKLPEGAAEVGARGRSIGPRRLATRQA